jgi:hypothetical protein
MSVLIDCDTCAVRDIGCSDCVMTVLLRQSSSTVELDSAEQDALGALATGGLLPPLRLVALADPTRPKRSERGEEVETPGHPHAAARTAIA